MHAAPEYVVVNKPPGVPAVPPVDNILESVLACAAQVRLLLLVLHTKYLQSQLPTLRPNMGSS